MTRHQPSSDTPTVEPTRDLDEERTLERLHTLSYTFDNAIPVPGTDYRIGLDAVLGLFPVVGDAIGSLVSAYIITEAMFLGVPRDTLYRMLFNLAVDTFLGSIPIVGDVFDAIWKANSRNVHLLDSRLEEPAKTERDRLFFLLIVLMLVFLILTVTLLTALLIGWVLVWAGVVSI